VAESLDRTNRQYRERYKQPFSDRDLFPQFLHFSSTDRLLNVVGLQAGGGKVAAPDAPPPVVEGADMTLQLHESAINNLAFDALANRTVYEDKAQAGAKSLLGRLPESLKGEEDGSLWAMIFDAEEPVRVTFADNGFKVIIKCIKCQRGKYFYSNGTKKFSVSGECGKTEVSALYTIQHGPEGFKAIRKGPVRVAPYGSAGSGVEQRSTRLSLKHRFEKMLKPEFVSKGLEFSGRWKAAGKLMPIQFECRDGWALLAWKRAAAATVAAAKEDVAAKAAKSSVASAR
jgi:hypothetical protein